MKKLALFTSAFLFSTLFYGKAIGLNLLIFSLITLIILYINNSQQFKNRKSIGFAIIYVVTGITVFFHDSALSIIANFVAFFTLIGHISELKSSIYINWLNGLYSTIVGVFHRTYVVKVDASKCEDQVKVNYIHLAKIIIIPAVMGIIFIALYQNGNPVFSNLISKIDFSFINIQWLLLAGLGYYLFNNIHRPIEVEPATELDLKTNNNLIKTQNFSLPKLKEENQLGIALITLLNLLIVLFLITDITFLTRSEEIRASVFSAQVHSGINALIASILIAIIILLYVFRGDLNFYKNNRILKKLALTWIILNLILVLIIAFKNGQYIYYFGLTYKRIGVAVYLILAAIGLLTTLIKINRIKNIWYLLRSNTQVAFIILIISCSVNWDYQITNYNFNYAKSMDFDYLLNLSNNNVLFLKEQSEFHSLDETSKQLIEEKYKNYAYELRTNSWQELQYDNFKIQK